MADRWFASDNNAGTHPRIMEALARANEGHAVGYGDDPVTERAEAAVAALFGPGASVRFVLNGTGANVYAIGCFAGPGDAVFCSETAHILVDETGAPPAALGVQLAPVRTRLGKIDPRALEEAVALYGDVHKPRPAILSLSQPTELGTVYGLDELAELITVAHEAGMKVHIDGARLSNAAVSLGLGLAAASGYASGADAVCFGGTKNGLMFGEAVVFAAAASGGAQADTRRLRKTRLQLASKMRYIAAQFEEYVKDGLWESNARAANAMARRLADGARALGVPVEVPVDSNGVFARVAKPVADELKARSFFYDWEDGLVRWMTSWDTTESDVDAFLAGLSEAVRALGPAGSARGEPAGQAEAVAAGRAFLRSNWDLVDAYPSPESLGLPAPPLTRPVPAGARLTPLPPATGSGLGQKSFADISGSRRSRRRYAAEALSLAELSFLLWSTAGVKSVKNGNGFRTVPSGGCRHPLDTVLYVRRVDGLTPGLYRYEAESHGLALLSEAKVLPGADTGKNGWLDLDEAMDEALGGQLWNCAVAFVWTAVPRRTEWRYTVAAAKTILLDTGHACQALYMACESLGLGTCALASYDQARLDAALGLDGDEEFAVYAAPVGRLDARPPKA